jgi:hypothetical protein
MSAYTSHLGVVHVDGIRYCLTAALPWEIGCKGSGLTVTVPKGFIFDVSIPLPLWWLFDPNDRRTFKAAALHDWLLQDGWSRVTAAAEFNNALTADRVPFWRRLTMFLAVALWKYR